MLSRSADKNYRELSRYVTSLREEVSTLSDLLADKAQDGGKQASDRMGDLVNTLRDVVSGKTDKALKSGRRAAADANNRFSAASDDVEDRVKDNPWAALLIAGAVGLAIGFMSRG